MTVTSIAQAAPGKPDELARAGNQLTSLADDILDTRGHIKRLVDGVAQGSDVLQGGAARTFAEEFEDLPRDLLRFSKAAHNVGSALTGWATDVEELQAEAGRALNRYRAQKRRRDACRQQVAALSGRLTKLRRDIGASEVSASGHLRDHRREALLGQGAQADYKYQLYTRECGIQRELEQQRATLDREHDRQRDEQDAAESEIRSAQDALERVLDEHRHRDRLRAGEIDRALPGALRNKSLLEKGFAKSIDFLTEHLDDLGSFLQEFTDTLLDMYDAVLDGDWDRAVFRFRELIDLVTPILTVLVMVLSVVALFIPVPGLNVLLAAALVLAVARLASTSFLLARDADDPDYPGRKAASVGELITDGVNVAAAFVAARYPPRVTSSTWASGGRNFLKGEPAKGLLKVTPAAWRQPVAVAMKNHPGATKFVQHVVWGRAVKPLVEKYAVKGAAEAGEFATGVDSEAIESGINVARDGSKVIRSGKKVLDGRAPGERGKLFEREMNRRNFQKKLASGAKGITSEFVEAFKADDVPCVGAEEQGMVVVCSP
jgi:hypothetical protein